MKTSKIALRVSRTSPSYLISLTIVCFVAGFALCHYPTRGSHAAINQTFIVTSTAFGPGSCTAGSSTCTLVQAINDSNANPPGAGNTNLINFAIPGSGVKTISTGGFPLPLINQPVIIDGYSQPGASPNSRLISDDAVLLIEVNGSGPPVPASGLFTIAGGGSGSTIRGLVINGFTGFPGIEIDGNLNTIQGNFIGTNTTGTAAIANFSGVRLLAASSNLIGGPTSAARNVISGNLANGIEIAGGLSNTVGGNLIGVATDASTPLANTQRGVVIDNSQSNGVVLNTISGNTLTGVLLTGSSAVSNQIQTNRIGTDGSGSVALPNGQNGIEIISAAHRNSMITNIVSGNTANGISMHGAGVSDNVLIDNWIGTDVLKTLALGNGGNGINIFDSASRNTIGGETPNLGNVIAFNAGKGVVIGSNASDTAATGNSLRLNSIFTNGGLGIDLGNDGLNFNDAGDADTGPNNLQNSPVLISAVGGSGGTTLNGYLNSSPNTLFIIDFFWLPRTDSCSGRHVLGSISVTTDSSGNAPFTANFASPSLAGGTFVTATATKTGSPADETSEFSRCFEVTGAPNVVGSTVQAVEGIALVDVVVAAFNGSSTQRESNFTATIEWGDGGLSAGSIFRPIPGGQFVVRGSHTYTEEGSYVVRVTVHDLPNNFDGVGIGAANVIDAALSIVPLSAGVRTQFSGVGGTNASGGALTAFNAFKAAIGGSDNGANPPPQASGFRTINWDGVALDGTDFGGNSTVIVPNKVVGIPVNRFQERGVEFEEVYAVSGDGFLSVNPTVGGQFPAFSPTKTFAMFNDNTIDLSFVVPSSHNTAPVQAITRAFGAIFLDVETPNTTSIEYFSGNTSLGKFFVPVGGSGQPEFLGEVFQNAAITNVHIELGNATLFSFNGTAVTTGAFDSPPATDLAVTDDFAYAEPTAIATGITINAIAGTPFTAKVASFTDADPNGQVSDYSAIVDWGDGTSSAVGAASASTSQITTDLTPDVIIVPNINGGFDVIGTHTYNLAGTFTITTSIRDSGGARIGAKSIALVGTTFTGSFQFNSAATNVAENSPTVALTVTRTGDTSGPASVNFETSDGSAVQKSDYTFNSGTIQFGPGESSKVINVSLVNDNLVEGNELFFVTLHNPSFNNQVGSPSSITVTINDDDTVPPTTNPIDDPTFFVRQHYLDFLGREPDAAGLAFWVGQINSCGASLSCVAAKRVDVSASFFLSIEFQETGGYALRIQRAAFGRQSDDPSSRYPYLQFMRDAREVGQGVIVGQPGFDTLLEQNKQTYAGQIAASNEFAVRFPAAPAAVYVDALFASAGVTPTSADRTAAINAFGAGGTVGRVAALRSVADSASMRTAESRVSFVLAEYYGYLRRNPTDAPDFNNAGYQFWLDKLNLFNGNYIDAEMVKAFITSIEYRQRFGP